MTRDGRPRHTGRSTPRLEDARLVTGQASWVGTMSPAGTLHLAVARSPLAHARIVRADAAAARARPGVVAAFTAHELAAAWRRPFPVNAPSDTPPPGRWPLAADKVRHVGEAVAVVVGTTAAAAADALEAVDIDYEPLPAVPDIDAALCERALVHEDAGSNVAFRTAAEPVGDVDGAFRDADVVLERRYVQQRLAAMSLEGRATLAVPEPDGRITVYTSTQVPGRVRDALVHVLDHPAEALRVVAPDVGGGFGAKLECYPEDVLCTELARRLGRPVRYVATRSEEFQATNHGRGQVQQVAVAARRDGTLLGLRARITADCGAYLSRNGAFVHLNAGPMFPGCYRWSAYRFDATGVFTTAMPTGAYRGAGRPEATFGIERAIDDLAAALELDPAELRRRNYPAPDEFPFPSVGGLTFDSGDYRDALDRALAAVGYDDLRAEQQRRRAAGETTLLGIGLSSYVDRCGAGPGMPEYGAVRVGPHGKVEVLSGLTPTGQGTATSLAQITADALGVEPDEIAVVHSDTAEIPWGKGTFGSRSTPVGAAAVHQAALEVGERARRIAAHLLEASAEDVHIANGGFAVRGSPEAAVTLAAVAGAAHGGNLPPGMPAGLEAAIRFRPDGLTFPFGTHVAVVEVDSETGLVWLRRFVAVDDAGTVINPLLVDGQLRGGIAQGVAQALYEEISYDEDGNLRTATLVDYLTPGAPDLPPMELHRTVTPTTANPLGAKGAGESGTIGATPAVVNAAVDALRHLGVDDLPMPLTPQRVWRAIHDVRRAP